MTIIPENIHIETRQGCNRSCWFCPNSHIENTGALMADALFYNIVEQLVQIDYDGTVRPYLMNECLLDERILDLVRFVADALPHARIVINTNGDLLDEETARELLDLRVKLRVSAYDHATRDRINAMALDIHVTDFALPRHALAAMFNNRSGNIDMPGARPRQGGCWLPWVVMPIRWNGDVVLCCNDFGSEVVMGNANTEGLLAIWENANYEMYRHFLGRCDRQFLPLCQTCSFVGM